MHVGNRERDGELSWREYIRYIHIDSPNIIKGLTLYQILGAFTSQTNEGRCEVCWKKGSTMTGQPSCQRIHNSVCREELMCITELQGHSGNNLDISTSSHTKIQKGQAQCLYKIGFSRSDDSKKKNMRIWSRRFGKAAGNQCISHSCRHWIRTPTRSTSLHSH